MRRRGFGSLHRGANVLRSRMTTIMPTAIPMTVRGLILIPFSFSVSKYLMRPAEDWKPVSFFFAMEDGYLRSI